MSNMLESLQGSRSTDCPPCPGKPVLDRIEARTTEIGRGFIVRRALPSKARRMVGPWCFLDHAGPVEFQAGEGLSVGPHPHIGLQTFTWLIEGEALHRDSLGYEQLIRPGQVNLMTAGRGIAHAEESPNNSAGRLHAAQLWIALPEHERHRDPSFQHYPELPVFDLNNLMVTVLAGESHGKKSPAEVFSPLVGLDISSPTTGQGLLQLKTHFEHAVICLQGRAKLENEPVEPGTLLYLGQGRESIHIECEAATKILLVGGEPFSEDILVWWNFVARTSEEIAAATDSWNRGEGFGEVVGTQLKSLKAPELSGMKVRR